MGELSRTLGAGEGAPFDGLDGGGIEGTAGSGSWGISSLAAEVSTVIFLVGAGSRRL